MTNSALMSYPGNKIANNFTIVTETLSGNIYGCKFDIDETGIAHITLNVLSKSDDGKGSMLSSKQYGPFENIESMYIYVDSNRELKVVTGENKAEIACAMQMMEFETICIPKSQFTKFASDKSVTKVEDINFLFKVTKGYTDEVHPGDCFICENNRNNYAVIICDDIA